LEGLGAKGERVGDSSIHVVLLRKPTTRESLDVTVYVNGIISRRKYPRTHWNRRLKEQTVADASGNDEAVALSGDAVL